MPHSSHSHTATPIWDCDLGTGYMGVCCPEQGAYTLAKHHRGSAAGGQSVYSDEGDSRSTVKYLLSESLEVWSSERSECGEGQNAKQQLVV